MKRRRFFKNLAATALLTGKGPVWGARPWSGFPEAPRIQAAGEVCDAEFFYKPKDAWAGDFIPFYEAGRFHLFYLQTWRDIPGHGEGTPWYQISTSDCVHFKEHGQMLARGSKDEQDLYVYRFGH